MTRPTRADTAARMAQHFETMNEPRRINWPVAIGVVCTCGAVVGGMTWAVARALGVQ